MFGKRFFTVVLPRLYSDASVSKGEGYYTYETLNLKWGRQDDYEIIEQIGRGKYSEVHRGINILDYTPVTIKILKPVKEVRLNREVRMLQILDGQCNVPKLIELVKDYGTQIPSLILEYCERSDPARLSKELTDFDVRYYIYEILKALEFSHSHGIMHRDVKPGNIVIDHKKRKIRLIDWGLADFYLPKKNYSVRVASRYYKGPELLVGYEQYDYSLDVWSLGVTFAEMIFQKSPFFHGEDNDEVLLKIVQALGAEDFYKYLEKYHIVLESKAEKMITNFTKKPWSRYITQENKHLSNDLALNLLGRMLEYDHNLRILPIEAMRHEYFLPVREMWEELDKKKQGLSDSVYKETARILKGGK